MRPIGNYSTVFECNLSPNSFMSSYHPQAYVRFESIIRCGERKRMREASERGALNVSTVVGTSYRLRVADYRAGPRSTQPARIDATRTR